MQIAFLHFCSAFLGIRDVSDKLPLPSISYDCIDEKACEYDEMRCCSQCNYVCVLSAIACECNHTKVCCPRHVSQFCKCPMDKKYLLSMCPYPYFFLFFPLMIFIVTLLLYCLFIFSSVDDD